MNRFLQAARKKKVAAMRMNLNEFVGPGDEDGTDGDADVGGSNGVPSGMYPDSPYDNSSGYSWQQQARVAIMSWAVSPLSLC